MSGNSYLIDLKNLNDEGTKKLIQTVFEDIINKNYVGRETFQSTVISYEKNGRSYHCLIGTKESAYILSLKAHKAVIDRASEDERHKTMLCLNSALGILNFINRIGDRNDEYTGFLDNIKLSITAVLEELRKQAQEDSTRRF